MAVDTEGVPAQAGHKEQEVKHSDPSPRKPTEATATHRLSGSLCHTPKPQIPEVSRAPSLTELRQSLRQEENKVSHRDLIGIAHRKAEKPRSGGGAREGTVRIHAENQAAQMVVKGQKRKLEKVIHCHVVGRSGGPEQHKLFPLIVGSELFPHMPKQKQENNGSGHRGSPVSKPVNKQTQEIQPRTRDSSSRTVRIHAENQAAQMVVKGQKRKLEKVIHCHVVGRSGGPEQHKLFPLIVGSELFPHMPKQKQENNGSGHRGSPVSKPVNKQTQEIQPRTRDSSSRVPRSMKIAPEY
ncbi:PHD finger family protein isoform 2 [Dorcoceras hygrometricum]|uniref:PHD finger family protein isoform 2 n=1 Tax=Dorcoceras hygrometricum TaxID=472368 RepID=A0A2Z7C5Q4_9LAMI|nr:PHD finger family protein isoform 2 [Dorcoceras hygrometricum]